MGCGLGTAVLRPPCLSCVRSRGGSPGGVWMKPFWFISGPGSASLLGRRWRRTPEGDLEAALWRWRLLRPYTAPQSPFPQCISPRASVLGEMSVGEPSGDSWEPPRCWRWPLPQGAGLLRRSRVLGTCAEGKWPCAEIRLHGFNRLGAHSRAATEFWHLSGKKSVVTASFILIKSCCARCVLGGGYKKPGFFGVTVTGREQGG